MDSLDVVNAIKSADLNDLARLDAHTRPRSKEELRDWAWTYFGWTFASVQICEHHRPPLDILWELFNEDLLDAVILASRTGGKTAMLATLNVLDAVFKPGCEVASMGAVLYQAEKGYKYFHEMMQSELFVGDVRDSMMKVTNLVNGSLVQIIPGTMTGTNAPHPHKFRADEVELIEWTILQQAFSMARSAKGIMGSNVLSSTRKTIVGSMQRLLDKIDSEPAFPFSLRSWCVKEVLERCDGNCAKCRDLVRPGDERSFWDVCKGDARHSDGFYMVRDAQRKFVTIDPDVWDAEWECNKPAKKGLVYKDMPEDRFGRYPFDPVLDTFGCIDDGFVDPFCLLLCQKDAGDNVYVVRELYGSGVEHSTWISDYMRPLFEELGLRRGGVVLYVDVRAVALIAELRKAGFKVKARSYSVVDSIRHVKKWVRGVAHPKLFVDEECCPNLKWEMGLYRYKEKSELPVDESNHAVDALRYGICGVFPRFDQGGEDEVPIFAGDKGQMASKLTERESSLRRAALDYSPRRGDRWPM